MRPIGDRIIVRPLQEENIKGFILSEDSLDKPVKGVVVSTAEDNSNVSEGDVILFRKFSPVIHKDKDDELYILDMEDVLAVL